MQAHWAEAVRTEPPRRTASIALTIGGRPAEEEQSALPADPAGLLIQKMIEACGADRVARNDVLLLAAQRLRLRDEPLAALALLDEAKVRPGDRSLGLFFAEWLKAHTAAGSLDQALPSVIERHEQALRERGISFERSFIVGTIAFRAYRNPDRADGWLLIGRRSNGEIETIAAGVPGWAKQYGFQDDLPPFAFTNARCTISNQPFDEGEGRFDDSITLERIVTLLEATYADPERDWRRDDLPGVPDFCPNLDDMLPGFGPVAEFLGAEYRDRNKGYSEEDLLAGLIGADPELQAEATDCLFDHPETIEPLYMIYGIGGLISRGDMERATFWYYIWQTRTRPWMAEMPEIAQARGALGAMIGPQVLEWAGSDYDAMLALWRRAIRYEQALPLYKGRPGRISEATWAERIAEARAENSEEAMLGDIPPKAEYEAARQSNGLYVGPWITPGRPLKDEWR